MPEYDARFEKTGMQATLKTWGKICYFVMGNAGSGTRLVTRIIGNAPGVLDNASRLNANVNMNKWRGETADKVVIKRDGSYQPTPYLDVIAGNIRKARRLFWVFTIRRPSRYEIYGKPQRLPEYMAAVEPEDLWVVWDNSLLYLDPENYLKEMSQVLLLDLSGAEAIRNEDKKWMEQFLEVDLSKGDNNGMAD